MDFEKVKILSGKYWDVFLHEDQTAIGRLYFWYKDDILDFLDIPEEAILEFYKTGKNLKEALVEVFQPDMFNYLALNNNTRHLHIHLIPRYSRKIEKFGIVFEDKSFGKNYKRDPDFKVPEEILFKIIELIKAD